MLVVRIETLAAWLWRQGEVEGVYALNTYLRCSQDGYNATKLRSLAL